jgi:tRNA (guanosine-2'-O-)-methyltransferase
MKVAMQKRRTSLTPEREATIRRVLALRQKDLTLVLANIHDPHNVSAIYRSCDAFGVPCVHLYYTDTAFPMLGAKSSASARKWVQTVRHQNLGSLMAALKEQDMRVYATSCTPQAKDLVDLDLTLPTAFIMGNEHRGVDQEFEGRVDAEVCIPMYGMIQSFNVSVAAAILLAETSRQRRAAGMYDRSTYSEEEQSALYAEWAQK